MKSVKNFPLVIFNITASQDESFSTLQGGSSASQHADVSHPTPRLTEKSSYLITLDNLIKHMLI